MSISIHNVKRAYCTIVELFDVKDIVTFTSELEVTQDNWNIHHSISTACFLFTFCSNYGRICSRFNTIDERDTVTETARQQSRVYSRAAEIDGQ